MALLDSVDWPELIAEILVGKRVAGSLYVHVSALQSLSAALVDQVAALSEIPTQSIDVCKFALESPGLSLLHYPGFFTDAFPVLSISWTVDLANGTTTERRYDAAANPPILHRKEQMLAPDHPDAARFARLTAQAEAAGLFNDTAVIGHAAAWEEELASLGLVLVGHDLVTRTATVDTNDWQAARHRTAIARTGLSSPVQALWRHGLLTETSRFFDYGCGRGDDVALLGDRGIAADGWDPWFRAESPRFQREIVNIGFVLNVIEDLEERRQALRGAWQLAEKVLSVAALIGGRTAQDRWRLYQDGVLTSRGTFQKYFSHAELGAYIAETLGREPIAVQPGIYFVFRTDEDEQDFLERRQRSRFDWSRPALPQRERKPRPERQPRVTRTRPTRPDRWEIFAELADQFWQECLRFGRIPDATEWPKLSDVQLNLARPEKALAQLLEMRDAAEFEAARTHRMDDLLVYLALQLFERRTSFGHLSMRLQRDVRIFWGSHARAMEEAKRLLFSTGQAQTVAAACETAHDSGIAWLERTATGDVDSLHLQGERLQQLPPVLRVYVGCAARMYGDVETADIIKIHAKSPKVTAQIYDDFLGRAVPDLIERVKIDLRRREIDVFGYGSEQFPPQPLWRKARLLERGSPEWTAQQKFDDELDATKLFDFSGFGPQRSVVEQQLASAGLRIDGWQLVQVTVDPTISQLNT